MKWDKGKSVYDVKGVENSRAVIPSRAVNHFKFKGIFTFKDRDFVEKGFTFVHNGNYYRYSSMVPPDKAEQLFPVGKDTVRGKTLINC